MKKIAIIDYGSQYTRNIKARLREHSVDAEIYPPDVCAEKLGKPAGIILSGSPSSIYDCGAPRLSENVAKLIFEENVPTLGICYGMDALAQYAARGHYEVVEPGPCGEYGKDILEITCPMYVLKNLRKYEQVWMSHGDQLKLLPPGFQRLDRIKDRAHPENSPPKAIAHNTKQMFGLQFHPEVNETLNGRKILANFLEICGAKKNWDIRLEFEKIKLEIAKKIGASHVLAFISTGVDSGTLAYTLQQIIPREQLHFCYVLGLGPDEDLEKIKLMNGNFNIVDARRRITRTLKGMVDPETKRKAIAKIYSRITLAEIKKIAKLLGPKKTGLIVAQGTIWPDIVEAGGGEEPDRAHATGTANIKTHHNTELRRLLKKLGFTDAEILEPFRNLFKPDVRAFGRTVGVPERILTQHPWPGPGYAVRFIGNDSATMPQEEIYTQAMLSEGEMQKICREYNYGAWILPVKSTGVQGDKRSYAYAAALIGPYKRAPLLDLATLIPNRFKGKINRVIYVVAPKDTTSLAALVLRSDCFRPQIHKMLKVATEKIFIKNLHLSNLYHQIAQAFVVATCTSFDGQGYSVVLRAVNTEDFMTASPSWLPEQFLRQTAEEIIAKIPEVQLVLYDLTSKPPGTIEWE